MRKHIVTMLGAIVAVLAALALVAPAANAADGPAYNPGFHATDLTQATTSGTTVISAKAVTATSYYNTTLAGYQQYGPRLYPNRANYPELQYYRGIALPAKLNQTMGLLCDQFADGIWWVKADYRIGTSGLFIGYFPVFAIHQKSVAALDQWLGSCF